ncbi:hypothetical protein BH09PAT2_BH09PAT2_02070 [soil metagenome]
MQLFSADIPTILLLTTGMSFILNIIFIFIIFYILRRPSINTISNATDQKIATNFKEAEFEATELMKDATEKAKRIIQDAGIIKDTLDSRLEKSLVEMTEKLNEKILTKEEEVSNTFKKVFDTIAQSYQNEGTTLVSGFKDQGDILLKTFIQTMHAEINSVRQQIFEKVDTKMELIEEDLIKYREEQQKRLNQNMQKIAKNTIELYMKDTLAYENNEQILFKVLDRFKKESPNTITKK